ncbi:MAG: hypothetical protein ACR2FG_01845, partial [Marmoricola sp.]
TLPTSTVAAAVTAIGVPAQGADALVITVTVPSGGAGCASRPEARVIGYDRRTLRMETVVESNQSPDCTRTTSRTFTTQVAVRGRQLVVNGQSWEPAASGSFTRCSARVGCAPPDDRCDPVWTRTLTPHFDLPPQKSTTVVACSGRWLVLDVDATSCRSTAGSISSSECTGTSHRRWFAELDAQRNWRVVASGSSAGCVDVKHAVPAFPRSLCKDLPGR